jgi:FixJ family two-component response regulator
VDDDLRVRESFESLLESAGYRPLMFESAEAFLGSGQLDSLDCLVTDVRMSGMNGLELQRAVRQQRPTLPVIFVSAHYDDTIRSVALAEGALVFITKPFEGTKLLDAIRSAVEKPAG